MLIPTKEKHQRAQTGAGRGKSDHRVFVLSDEDGNDYRVKHSAISLLPFQHNVLSAPSRECLDWWKPPEEWQGE